MSADDLSASGRWARDPYVQALEEQLKKLGFKEDELKQLKKDAKAKKGGSRVQPLTFEEVRARRIEAYLKAEQDPRFTIPVEVSLAYSFLHCGILWGFVDFFPQNGYGFWYYLCYFFLFVSLLTYMAQFLAVAMPNQQVASSLGMAYLSMTANVSGFSIMPQDIPGGWMSDAASVRPSSPERSTTLRAGSCTGSRLSITSSRASSSRSSTARTSR